MKTLVCLLGLTALTFLPARADQKVIVHEWGTFTCLQDDQGRAIGGINVDDEPVPYFVSSVAIGVAPQYVGGGFGFPNLGLPPYREGKGWIAGDPRVTMRLETPVIYIYPPKGQQPASVPALDVHVDFHGGVLSQFYPHADFSGLPLRQYPGQPNISNRFPYIDKNAGLTEATTTSLDWKGVQLGSAEKPRETDDKVWTTPREVGAPVLQVQFTDPDFGKPVVQAEHFLFYRGVGHLDSPLLLNQTSLDAGKRGDIFPWCHKILTASPSFEPPAQGTVDAEAWLADIHSDGSCRWEYLPISFDPSGSGVAGKFIDFKDANFTKLKASMHAALVKEGLYDDEATAMLKTWDLSYFKSPGLRFFYIVPRAWVDKVLPLKISGPPTDLTRVMIGRIELITDAQKAALAHLSAGPCPDLASLKQAALDALDKGHLTREQQLPYYSGDKPLADLVPVPPLVQDYLNLGRFRDALIVREQHQHPSDALAQFIKDNQLAPQEN